jgi:hypothetical protein
LSREAQKQRGVKTWSAGTRKNQDDDRLTAEQGVKIFLTPVKTLRALLTLRALMTLMTLRAGNLQITLE